MPPSVAAIYSHVPGNVRLPAEVQKDSEGGVTEATFQKILGDGQVELTARLDMAEVPEELREHPLLVSYLELVTAARITRRMRVMQEVADSLFADANIKLRLFFERHNLSEDLTYGDTVQPDDTGDMNLPSVEEWTYGFLID